jgi:polyisoprenyl-phosphate glycosyltransferase
MNGTRADNSAMAQIALSIVAPCYNEQDCLGEFVGRMIKAAETAAGESYELILVNDGSRDNTWPCIRAITQTNPRILGVNLSRNHGHQLAVTAGLSLTRGAGILIIDADLQDPPELLPEMTARLKEGFDVVYGRRRTRAKESAFKLVTANFFYRILRMLSDVEIPADTGDFRLMSRRIADRLNAMPEHDRFLRGMVAWLGGKQTEILYDRDPRFAGQTGYTLPKMLRLAASGVVGFSTRPLKLSVFLASIGMLIGIGVVLYAVTGYVLGNVAPGWTSQALITIFFGVAQLGCLAVMGSYLGRTYMQVKARPLFMIDEISALPASRDSKD